MPKAILHGDIFRRGGAWFRVEHERDDCHAAPDKECDGHGIVTDWQPRMSETEAKAAGLWLLSDDRGSARYYDARATLEIAKRDQWGRGKSESARRRAVRRDFEYLRGWYTDQWEYIGVTVERISGARKGEKASLWGIESCARRYLSDVARELADELL